LVVLIKVDAVVKHPAPQGMSCGSTVMLVIEVELAVKSGAFLFKS
jgi:hypothetical protein